jgi:hypothetical protein
MFRRHLSGINLMDGQNTIFRVYRFMANHVALYDGDIGDIAGWNGGIST